MYPGIGNCVSVQFALVRPWASSAQQKASELLYEAKWELNVQTVPSAEVPLLLRYCSIPAGIIKKMLHKGLVFCNGCNWKVCHSFSVVHSILNSKWRHWNNMLCLSYPACPAGAYEVNVCVCERERWRMHVHEHICRLLLCVLRMRLQELVCVCLFVCPSNTVNDLLYYIPSGCSFVLLCM